MPDILIRDLDEALDRALKMRAIEHGCTREAKIKAAIYQAPKKRPLTEALMDILRLDTTVF